MRPAKLQATLAADPDLGAGNVLVKLIEHGAAPDQVGITFDVDVDGHPAWTAADTRGAAGRVAARAAWLHAPGIGPRDPVAVYVTSSADVLLNFMALDRLGAIPALMNGNMPGDIAAEYIRAAARRRGDHRRRRTCDLLAATTSASRCSPTRPRSAPAIRPWHPRHYRHHADDPVADHPLLRHDPDADRGGALASQPVRGDPAHPAHRAARAGHRAACSARCPPRTPPASSP